ncbi:MAG: hypothetical protein J5526_02965 [Bacteroidales bacterium]|nr:hypothetical protein [Bacteroidales bacterium]
MVGAYGQTTGHPRFSLTVSNGSGYGEVRDLGTSPRVYDNLSLRQGLEFNAETVGWSFSGRFGVSGALNTSKIKYLLKKGSYSGYSGSVDIAISALRQVWCNSEATWSIAVGGGLSNHTYIGYTPKFMNASFALTDLFQPDFQVMVQYNLPNSNPLVVMPGWFAAFASVTVSPIGLAYRPGYSFIDNYTDGREVKNYIFNTYRTAFAWLPQLTAELGVRFNLRSGNRISLAYMWNYRSSHGTADWQFDEVNHLLSIELNILLKK